MLVGLVVLLGWCLGWLAGLTSVLDRCRRSGWLVLLLGFLRLGRLGGQREL